MAVGTAKVDPIAKECPNSPNLGHGPKTEAQVELGASTLLSPQFCLAPGYDQGLVTASTALENRDYPWADGSRQTALGLEPG